MVVGPGTPVRSRLATSAARLGRSIRYLAGDLVVGLRALALLILVVITAAASLVGVGLAFAGTVARGVRRHCDRDRARTGRFLDRRIASPYADPSSRRLSMLRSYRRGATLARDLAVLLHRILLGIPLGLLAVLLPFLSLNAVSVALYWWALPDDEPTGTLFAVTSWWDAAATALLGLAGLALWFGAPAVAAADAGGVARLLSPSPGQELRLRAEMEERRRRSAVSAHTAELRRIERDLHDATQNRLVAVAMFIGMAQRQLTTRADDPAPALAKAQAAATDALAEVRRVIQGIFPPELAEEGLIPALGLLVDRAQIPIRLHVDRPGPTPPAVDAALYFSIAEILTNVAKHSGADECEVQLSWDGSERDRWVTATVSDNGRGGADPGKGSGLTGIDQRMQALGGEVSVLSPPGGPTTIRMALPCES